MGSTDMGNAQDGRTGRQNIKVMMVCVTLEATVYGYKMDALQGITQAAVSHQGFAGFARFLLLRPTLAVTV